MSQHNPKIRWSVVARGIGYGLVYVAMALLGFGIGLVATLLLLQWAVTL